MDADGKASNVQVDTILFFGVYQHPPTPWSKSFNVTLCVLRNKDNIYMTASTIICFADGDAGSFFWCQLNFKSAFITLEQLLWKEINSQSLEDTQVGKFLQKYTLEKYILEKYTLEKYNLENFQFFEIFWKKFIFIFNYRKILDIGKISDFLKSFRFLENVLIFGKISVFWKK